VYFPCWFLKIAIIISHSHYLFVAFVSILVFQTFDRMKLGIFEFSWSKVVRGNGMGPTNGTW